MMNKVPQIFILLAFFIDSLNLSATEVENWREWQRYFNKATCPSEICQRQIQETHFPKRVFFSMYKALEKNKLNSTELFYREKIEQLQKRSFYRKDRSKMIPYKSYVIEPKQGEFLYSHKEAPRQISDHKLVKTVFKIGDQKITHGSLNTLLMADARTGDLGRTTISSERVYDIFHYLIANDLDIICLQEVFSQQSDSKKVPKSLKILEGLFPGERARLVLIRLLTLAGYDVITNAGKNNFFNGKFENSGLLIASKFNLSDPQFFSYTFDGKIQSQMTDKLADKGVLKARASVGGINNIVIYNTHTQASVWEWDLHDKNLEQAIELENKNIKSRVKQFQFLSDLLQAEKNYELLISCGDFNLSTKILEKYGNTLIYQEDNEKRELKTYMTLFADYLSKNLLEEDTWISEYHENQHKIMTGDYRINGVTKYNKQGPEGLTLLEKKGEKFVAIPLLASNDSGDSRKRPRKYNIEWSYRNNVAFDQVLFKLNG